VHLMEKLERKRSQGRYRCRRKENIKNETENWAEETYTSFMWLRMRPIINLLKTEVKVTLQLTVSQSLCQGIEPILGLVTRYYSLSEGCFLNVAVLSLWGALSDERSGLSFVLLSL
jgi:hypothetical protein